jgi:formylglycine-generating enzyme required for sulfatase activity
MFVSNATRFTLLVATFVLSSVLVGCPYPPSFPVALFSATPKTGTIPLMVMFKDHSMSRDGDITAWRWQFGDGTESDSESVEHVYTAPGTYTVQLTVTSSTGEDSIVVRDYIHVLPRETETYMLPDNVPLTMVSIPGGTFMMGSTFYTTDEQPVHEVTISNDFQLGQTEITKGQWDAVMGTALWAELPAVLADPLTPATAMNLDHIQTFIAALNELTGEHFRLPTEAEWEYACRAGTTTEYYFGDSTDNMSDYAWWEEKSLSVGTDHAQAVAQLLPNNFGLYDMTGNVWERCEDRYHDRYYEASPNIDPSGPTFGNLRVKRGGCWAEDARDCRSSSRSYVPPWGGSREIGFRLAK